MSDKPRLAVYGSLSQTRLLKQFHHRLKIQSVIDTRGVGSYTGSKERYNNEQSAAPSRDGDLPERLFSSCTGVGDRQDPALH